MTHALFFQKISSHKPWFTLVLLITIGVTVASVLLTEVYNLQPCPLCIFQRFMYLLIGLFALIGMLLPQQALLLVRIAALLTIISALVGLATAAYQSWIQVFPEHASDCGISSNVIERFVDWLSLQYPPFFMATGFCTESGWEFLGASIANWSLLTYLSIIILISFWMRRGHQ